MRPSSLTLVFLESWCLEGLVSTQFLAYTQVICNPSGIPFTWENGSEPNSGCQSPSFYLTDVNINACCNTASSLPLSARAYVLFGYTYPNGVHTSAWLGGNNGYNPNWIGYDYLYVLIAMLIVRVLAIVFTQFINHQRR